MEKNKNDITDAKEAAIAGTPPAPIDEEKAEQKTLYSVYGVISSCADEIKDFKLSTRAKNCLRRSGVFTLEKLMTLNEDFLSGIRNVGVSTRDEIMDLIKTLKAQPPHNTAAEAAEPCEALTREGDIGRQLENVDDFNKDIPVYLFKNIKTGRTIQISRAIEYMIGSGCKTVGELCEKNFTANEYNIIRPMAEYLKVSVVEHFIREINSLKDDRKICVVSRSEGSTLEEAGEKVGRSRERVRQIVVKEGRRLQMTADLIAGALFKRLNNVFVFSDLRELFGNEQIALCYKLVQQGSGYARYLKHSDKFVCSDICPANHEQLFNAFVKDIIGEGINLNENLELIEAELQKRSLGFLDSADVTKFLLGNGYHFYGDYITQYRQNYARACIDAVKTYFPFDIKLDDDENNEDMKKLRQTIDRHYQGLSLPQANKSLTASMTRDSSKMILSGRGRYCPVEKVSYSIELMDELRSFIEDSPQPSFYYNELYSYFEERLLAESNIHNYNFLHGALKLLYPDDFKYERDLLTKRNFFRQDVNDRLKLLIKKQGRAMTKNEMRKAIPGINDFVFTFAAVRLPEIIQWGYNELNHIGNIDVSRYDLLAIKNIIEAQTAAHSGYCSDTLLYTAAKDSCKDFMQRNRINSAQNLYGIANYYFGAEYRFRNPHIVTKAFPAQELSAANIARVLLKCDKEFDYEEYAALAGRLEWKKGAFRGVLSDLEKGYIRISENGYVNKDFFDISKTMIKALNKILHSLVDKAGYYAFLNILDYDAFPDCGYKWNGFLLETIITQYDTDFRVINPPSKDRRYQRGFIVPKDSHLT